METPPGAGLSCQKCCYRKIEADNDLWRSPLSRSRPKRRPWKPTTYPTGAAGLLDDLHDIRADRRPAALNEREAR